MTAATISAASITAASAEPLGSGLAAYLTFDEAVISNRVPNSTITNITLSDSGITSFLRLFSTVKITVAQSGLVSAITARPGQNVYIAVDWGDFSDPDVIGGTEDITIRIYGDMNLQRFDLSKIGGIYYVHSLVRCGEFEDGLDIPSLRDLIQII